jgi:predicted lipoprotein with Yx(FWY)xxD motif
MIQLMDEETAQNKTSSWLWVSLFVVVAVVVLGLAYYYLMVNKAGYKTPQASAPVQTQTNTPTTVQSSTAPIDNIYMSKTDPSKGAYLTDFAGMTLYTYGKDTPGVSNCTGTCAVNWPPYTSGATAQSTLPANISVITRADGSKQFAWKGMPLYYFKSDTAAGQITGDGVGGFSLAK